MDLKQERLCKKTTLWAKGKKNRQLFKSVSFWAKKRSFFFLENTEAYKIINILSKNKEEQNLEKQKDGQSQRWGKVKIKL